MFKVGEFVVTPEGSGVISAIHENAKFPMEVSMQDGGLNSFSEDEVKLQFKLHEKSVLRLNFVDSKHARQNGQSKTIPMYFEYEVEPSETYHYPNEYYPTAKAVRFAFAEYYGFPLEMISLDNDEYGDLRILFCEKPNSIVWWDLI